MANNKIKNRIYLRTFSVFLIIYLVLMVGFSAFLVSREKKTIGMGLRTYAIQVNNRVGSILQGHLSNGRYLIDVPKVKDELLQESPFLTIMDSEVAVFTDKYELLFNTNNYWRCSYTKYKDEKGYHVGYGYIDPEKCCLTGLKKKM
jgi:hypothetical protein